MANLRDLIDGKAVDTQDRGDVFNHLKKTKMAQVNYDLAKTQLHTKLAPTRQLLNLIDKEHPLDDGTGQQQFDEMGNPIPMQNQQLRPGMQTNPNNGLQQTNQNVRQAVPANQQQQKKPAFGNANKTSTKDKLENDKNAKNKKQVGGKKGLEIHVKAKSSRIAQMNVKKNKMKGQDYHDNAGMSVGQGRGVGLSGGRSK